MKKFINDLTKNLLKATFILSLVVISAATVSAFDGGDSNGGNGGGDSCGGCGGDSSGGYSGDSGYGYGGDSSGGGSYWSTPVYIPPVYVAPVVYTPTAAISPNPASIIKGNGSTLTWSSTYGTACTVTGGGSTFYGVSGTALVYPTTTTVYTVNCTGPYGPASAQTTVNVTHPVANPTANIYANPSSITNGNSTTLTWNSTNATRCVLNGGQFNNQAVAISGSVIATPSVGTNYTIQCFNAAGASASDATYVTVNQVQQYCTNGATNFPACNNHNVCTNGYTNYPTCGPTTCTNGTTNFPNCNVCPNGQTFINNTCTVINNTPTATIYPSSYSIYSGSNVTLYWSSTNASYCTAQPFPFSGSKNISGSESVNLTQTTTFTITCFNSNGQSAQAQTTVSVNQYNNDIYCNGVRYPAGSICPNNNNIAVSTTGSNPLTNSANIFGYVNPNNGNASMWFEYGTNYNLGNRTNTQYAYSAGSYSAQITGLSCGTRYYYRAVAQSNAETKYGSTLSFVTSACTNNNYTDSTVLTRGATLVYQNGAQLNGAFIYGNNSNNCRANFQYGTNYNLSNSTNSQSLYNNSGVNYFSSALSGLSPNTRYYYRAVSNCGGAIKYGSTLSFVTSGYVKHVKPHYTPKPITKVVTAPTLCNCDTNNVDNSGVAVANVQYMDLLIERAESAALIGGNAGYRVIYKNTSTTTLQDVVIRVILPEELSIVSADRGDYTAGGQSLTYTISQLSKLEEGRLNIVTKVDSKATNGNQIVVNAYANYSVPTIVKNGQLFKDEVTAYVLSILTNTNVNNGNDNANNDSNNMFGGNFWQWVVLLGLVLAFVVTIVYLFTATKRNNAN